MWDWLVYDVAGLAPESRPGSGVHFFFYDSIKIALLFGLFGIGPTLLYVGSGLVIAIVAGYVLGRLKLERWVEPFVFETRLGGQLIDYPAIIGYGVMSTPGLVVDEKVVMSGRVPSAAKVRELLESLTP